MSIIRVEYSIFVDKFVSPEVGVGYLLDGGGGGGEERRGKERLLNLLLKYCFERICVGDGEWWWWWWGVPVFR